MGDIAFGSYCFFSYKHSLSLLFPLPHSSLIVSKLTQIETEKKSKRRLSLSSVRERKGGREGESRRER